jgi:hypothetical protein
VGSLVLAVDLLDGFVECKTLLRKSLGDCLPDTSGTITRWEAESRIRAPVMSSLAHLPRRRKKNSAPVAGRLLVENVADDEFETGSSDTLSEPAALHLHERINHRSHRQTEKT